MRTRGPCYQATCRIVTDRPDEPGETLILKHTAQGDIVLVIRSGNTECSITLGPAHEHAATIAAWFAEQIPISA